MTIGDASLFTVKIIDYELIIMLVLAIVQTINPFSKRHTSARSSKISKAQKIITYLVIAGVILWCIAFFIYLLTWKQEIKTYYETEGQILEVTSTDHWVLPLGRGAAGGKRHFSMINMTYSYYNEVLEETIEDHMEFGHYSKKHLYDVGDSVVIYYAPTDPTKSLVNNGLFFSNILTIIIVLIMNVLFIGITRVTDTYDAKSDSKKKYRRNKKNKRR